MLSTVSCGLLANYIGYLKIIYFTAYTRNNVSRCLNVYKYAIKHLKVYLHKCDCFVSKDTPNIFRCNLFSTPPVGLNF